MCWGKGGGLLPGSSMYTHSSMDVCSLEQQAVPTLERVLISAPCIQR